MRKIALYLLFFAFLLPILVFGQQKNKQTIDPSASFNNYIKEALTLWKTPGLSVAVVKDGQVVFKKGYGVTELGKQSPFLTSTVSVCASTTKAMTAVCMGILVDAGKIKWEDKVVDFLPEFSLSDPYVTSQITVRDLFTHNAGLGNADWLWVMNYSREEIMKRMQKLPIAYSLRSSFIYQNLMYLVAGELIHKLSGMSWEDFISKNLFQAIGMSHTYPGYSYSKAEPSHANPHFTINDSIVPIPFIDHQDVGAAGAVWSCADDVSKWLLFLLDSTKINGKRLLKAETYAELFKPHSFVTESQFYPTQKLTHPHWKTYGLGWFQQDYQGKMVQFHTGSLDGVVAILGLVPENNFGIYIFGNLDHTEIRHALLYKAIDLWCLGKNTQDWSKEMFAMYASIRNAAKAREKSQEDKRVMNTKPSLPLSSYLGKFNNEAFGDAEIVLEKNELVLKYPGENIIQLQHWHYDTFRGTYNHFWFDKSWIVFSLDAEGKVISFDMDGLEYKKQ